MIPLTASDPVRPAMTMAQLGRELSRWDARLVGDGERAVSDVRQDSRAVRPGDLFVARRGRKTSGVGFAADAVARGAAAILTERGAELPELGVPVLEVNDVERAAAWAAEAVHGFPTRELSLVGITGTNGKTTTSWLCSEAIDRVGGRAARLGTLGFAFAGETWDSGLTTPQADDISRLARRVVSSGGTHLVMEVSSHALELGRVSALQFAAVAFTNLTQDHLDFHGSMQAYARAKRRLFEEHPGARAVLNVDDACGAELAATLAGRALRVSRTSRAADVFPEALRQGPQGVEARVRVLGRSVELQSRLVGEHNLDNLLLTLGLVAALGFDPGAAARGLGSVPAVPGRLERCDEPGDDLVVLVDYAHTPDALQRVLEATRSLTQGRLICVFGCGGDRDPQKRPRMGEVASRLADEVVVTNDNPRSEPPERIADAVVEGLRGGRARFVVELDRSRAIAGAIASAAAGDVVLIAGKGHEPYQIIGAERRSFDDREEARRALALRRLGTSP